MLYFFTRAQPRVALWSATHCVGLVIMTSLVLCFVLSPVHRARFFTCRLTIHVSFFVLSAFYSVALTRRVTHAKKMTRANAPLFSHIVSRQTVLFPWRILIKYPIMYLHIEWQRALNGPNILCTGIYRGSKLDRCLFFYIRLIAYLTLTSIHTICKTFIFFKALTLIYIARQLFVSTFSI